MLLICEVAAVFLLCIAGIIYYSPKKVKKLPYDKTRHKYPNSTIRSLYNIYEWTNIGVCPCGFRIHAFEDYNPCQECGEDNWQKEVGKWVGNGWQTRQEAEEIDKIVDSL